MNFTEAVKTCFKKYADFKGRASRSEYWWFFLATLLMSIALSIVNENLSSIFSIATLLPSIAVGVRRMHDVGKSGWYLLIPIYNLILACTDSEVGTNQYGDNPYVIGDIKEIDNLGTNQN